MKKIPTAIAPGNMSPSKLDTTRRRDATSKAVMTTLEPLPLPKAKAFSWTALEAIAKA